MAVVTPYSEKNKKKAQQQQAATGFTYDPFQVSSQTQKADSSRQQLQTQKPADFTYQAYKPSAAVQQAQTLLQQQSNAKPGAYKSKWQSQVEDLADRILNREQFTYDLNADALYQQYAQQYAMLGQQAMLDTMGQAAAMTGGYGNSYAQTAGQQAYQGYLQQLNDRVPALYQMALDRYNQQGQALMNQYGLLTEQEAQDYSRYMDDLNNYYAQLDRLTEDARYQSETDYGRYMDLYNMAYGQHRDEVADWQQALNRADQEYWNLYNRDYGQYADDRSLSYTDYLNAMDRAYQQERDTVADQQWQQQLAYQQERDKIADQQWLQQLQENQRQYDASLAEEKRQYDQQYALAAQKASNNSDSVDGSDRGSNDDADDDAYEDTGFKEDEKGGDEPVTNPYEGWTGPDWEGYFSYLRSTAGEAAALEEIRALANQGTLPADMMPYATRGAHGGM